MTYYGEYGFTEDRLDELHTDVARWHAGRADDIPLRDDLTDAHKPSRPEN